MTKKTILLVVLIVCTQLTWAYHNDSKNILSISDTVEVQKADTIPFTLTAYNNISVQSIVNQIDTLNLMFHTAASSMSITKNGMLKTKSIKMNKLYTGVKSWGGKNGESRFSENNQLQITNLTWDSISINENLHSGKTTDGKFGPDLFKGKVIEIDFEKKIMVIHASLPSSADEYNKFNLTHRHGLLFLEGILNIGDSINYTREFLIHSGYSGTILLDDAFVTENNIDQKITTISESQLKDSFGNALKTKKAILPNLAFGNITFPQIPVGFFQGAIGRQKMSILGGDLLKRFNIIIDIVGNSIYLKPNDFTNTPYSDI